MGESIVNNSGLLRLFDRGLGDVGGVISFSQSHRSFSTIGLCHVIARIDGLFLWK